MHCSLRPSGDEGSARSPYPGVNLSFLPRVALHNFNCNHTQFLVVFPADKPLHRWGLLFPPHHRPAIKCSQATVPTSSSIKTSQRSREGQTTSPWLSSRAYRELLAYRSQNDLCRGRMGAAVFPMRDLSLLQKKALHSLPLPPCRHSQGTDMEQCGLC